LVSGTLKARRADIVIVGAGMIGLCCAHSLARRGLEVVVLERETPGSGSSTRTGGGIRSQFGTATGIKLSVLSAPFWAEFEERTGVDVEMRRIGYLFLASDDRSLDGMRSQVAVQNRFGIPSEVLASVDLPRRWPILDGLRWAGGSFCATDGFVNHHRAIHGLVRAAEAAGVTIECGAEVTDIDLMAGHIGAVRTTRGEIRTDRVVNCAGAWAPMLAGQVGVSLPIVSRRVQLLRGYPSAPLPADLPWLIDPLHQVHVRQDAAGRVLVGGFLDRYETVDPRAFDHDADPDWITAVLRQAWKSFGIQIDRASLVDSWAGLYPDTPDQHPIIDETEVGMVNVGGFAGFGLMHAPAAGLVVTELVVDGRISSIDAEDVSLVRFSEQIDSVERTGF
jgi:sarcosine oxidase subunit beta